MNNKEQGRRRDNSRQKSPPQKGRATKASSERPALARAPAEAEAASFDVGSPPPVPERCEVVFYDTLAAAQKDLAVLKERAAGLGNGQLNIVIRAEAEATDPDLTALGRLYAGAAWTLIHERRQSDGWYQK